MRHRSNGLICNIDVTAFAGVMLVLVYLFMSPYPVCSSGRPAVDFPKVSSPVPMRAADREDAIVIGIERDGKVFFRTDRTSPEDLPVKIREALRRGAENKVYIKADARAKYASVKEVLDGIHAAGVRKIGILVDQRNAVSPPD